MALSAGCMLHISTSHKCKPLGLALPTKQPFLLQPAGGSRRLDCDAGKRRALAHLALLRETAEGREKNSVVVSVARLG